MEKNEDKKKKYESVVKVTNISVVQDFPRWNYFNLQICRDEKGPAVKTTIFTVACGADELHQMIKQIEISHF